MTGVSTIRGVSGHAGVSGNIGLSRQGGIVDSPMDGEPTDAFFTDDNLANQYFVNDAKTIAKDAYSVALLSGNSVIGMIGDSMEQHNGTGSNSSGSVEFSNWSRGYMNWAYMLNPCGRWINWYDANKSSKFYSGANQGVSGWETSQMLTNISRLTGIPGLKVAIVGGGTNDLNGIRDIELTKADLRDIYDDILAVGAKVIIMTVPPRPLEGVDSWASGSDNRLEWFDLCAWMQAQADADPTNIKIVRRDLICSNADADRTPKTGYLNVDNVHLAPMGGYAVAAGDGTNMGLAETIAQIVSPFVDIPAAVTAGDISTNPTLTGTGGSTGTGASGVVADTLTLARGGSSSTGVTVVASKETVDGIEYQKLVFTSTGGAEGGFNNANFTLSRSGGLTSLTRAGSWLRGWMQFKTAASPLLEGVSLRPRAQPSTPANMDNQSMKPDTGLLWPNVALQSSSGGPLWQSTPPFQLKDGTTSILWSVTITINNQAAGTTTVWISRMHLVPVPDPTIEY